MHLPLLFLLFSPVVDTPKKPVTDDYPGVGVKVVDDYRWLENAKDPEVRKWSKEQNAAAREQLDRLPSRAALITTLKQIYGGSAVRYNDLRSVSGVLFAMKTQPSKQHPFLISLKSADEPDSARTIVDPGILDPTGGTAIDFFVPSLDAKLVAVSLSQGGSEAGSLSVFETATGKQLSDAIPHVNNATAGGSVAWNADGSGFYYTRYPHSGERPQADMDFYQEVYFHRLGTPVSADTAELGKNFPRIAEIKLQSSADGKYILAQVANGDGGEFLHYILGPAGRWQQITRLADQVSVTEFAADDSLYALSRSGAPMGKILRLAAPEFSLSKAKTVVTAGRSSIADFLPTASRLYVSYMAGGPSKLLVTGLLGERKSSPQDLLPILPVSAVGGMVRLIADDILFENESFLQPSSWQRYDAAANQVKRTALMQTATVDFGDAEVVREMATSKDGTRIPLNIVRKKGTKLDGNNPVLLSGYGGYGISMTPTFTARLRIWLDYGGIFVLANLRGGGEFGEDWHEKGKLTNKQNVFDDFIASAEYLVKSKYTTPEKLAIEGGSNGGLLMGAALTQRPDLFRAVVSHVGIYDMLRVELSPNGAFNVTEFGTVKEPDQFKALYSYSPYHQVKDGTAYPAVLFLTGDNDGRVDPMNSRKMTARMQTATHGGRPVLLRTSANSGHGIGTALDERIEQEADVYAFLFDQLGMSDSRAVKP